MTQCLSDVLKDAKDGDEFIDAFNQVWLYKPNGLLRTSESTPFFIVHTEFHYIWLVGLRPIPKEKKKKIVRMAPALTKKPAFTKGYNYDLSYLFASRKDAEEYFEGGPGEVLKWPANDTMWVDVEVDE